MKAFLNRLINSFVFWFVVSFPKATAKIRDCHWVASRKADRARNRVREYFAFRLPSEMATKKLWVATLPSRCFGWYTPAKERGCVINSPYCVFGVKDLHAGYGMGRGWGFVVQVTEESLSVYRNGTHTVNTLGEMVFRYVFPKFQASYKKRLAWRSGKKFATYGNG